MTENKRFTIKGSWSKSLNRLHGLILDNNEDMYVTDVVYLLNKFSEENENLKEEIKDLNDILSRYEEKELEKMTEKRFSVDDFIKTYHSHIIDEKKEIITLKEYVDYLNELVDENEQLKKENKELRQDNDIKFWKLQCLQSSNNNQIMLFELSRAIQQGYEVSDKFKQYLDEIKEHDKEIREKHKRLFDEWKR